jgi:hypothetical protein
MKEIGLLLPQLQSQPRLPIGMKMILLLGGAAGLGGNGIKNKRSTGQCQSRFLADLPIHGGMLQHHEGMEIFLPVLMAEKLPEDIFSFDGEKSLIQSLGHNLADLNGLSHRSTTLNTLKVDS